MACTVARRQRMIGSDKLSQQVTAVHNSRQNRKSACAKVLLPLNLSYRINEKFDFLCSRPKFDLPINPSPQERRVFLEPFFDTCGPTEHRVSDTEGRRNGSRGSIIPSPPPHTPPSSLYHWCGPRPTLSSCTSCEGPRRLWPPRPPRAGGVPVVAAAAAAAGWPRPCGRGVPCIQAGGRDAATSRRSAAVRHARAPAIPRPHCSWATTAADNATALMPAGATLRPAHAVRG